MQTFNEWLLSEKKVVLQTCKEKTVTIPKGKDEKKYLAKLFAKGSKKDKA